LASRAKLNQAAHNSGGGGSVEEKPASFNGDFEARVSGQIGDLDRRLGDLDARVRALEEKQGTGFGAANIWGDGSKQQASPGGDGGGGGIGGRRASGGPTSPSDVRQARAPRDGRANPAREEPSGPDPLELLQNRVNTMVQRDIAAEAAQSGGTGEQFGGREDIRDSGIIQSLLSDVEKLKKDSEELRGMLRKLSSTAAGTGETRGGTAVAAAAGTSAESTAAVKRAESAAEAARMSALAAEHLRKELEEILRAVEVPSLLPSTMQELEAAQGSRRESREGGGQPGRDVGVDLGSTLLLSGTDQVATEEVDEQEHADTMAQYVQRQMEMETRMQQLEEQLDAASAAQPEINVVDHLKVLMKDVRRCLQRCELLYELPEIKAFVNKFRRSLEMNAVLHDRWLGPAKKGDVQDDLDERGGGVDAPRSRDLAGGDQSRTFSRHSEQSRSAPDLKASRAHHREGNASRKKGDVKKKPFRTVVDWVRPHTPLSLDPQFRHAAGASDARSDGPTTSLPPISRT